MFYIDTANELERAVLMHNGARFISTKPFMPWELAWYEVFETEKEACDCARYLKSSNGREFAYKRLMPIILNGNYAVGRHRIYEV